MPLISLSPFLIFLLSIFHVGFTKVSRFHLLHNLKINSKHYMQRLIPFGSIITSLKLIMHAHPCTLGHVRSLFFSHIWSIMMQAYVAISFMIIDMLINQMYICFNQIINHFQRILDHIKHACTCTWKELLLYRWL